MTDDVFALTDFGALDERDAEAAAVAHALGEAAKQWRDREDDLVEGICNSPPIVREYLEFLREQIDYRNTVIEWVAATIEGDNDE